MKKKLVLVIFLFILSIILYFQYKINLTEKKQVLITGLCIGVDYKNSENTNNIGIMTAIDASTNTYSAFGHKLNSELQNCNLQNCYKINNLNITKSTNENIGNLNANINSQKLGNVSTNSINGISGEITDNSIYTLDSIESNIGSRYKIKTGNAELYINLYGNKIQKYKIYIDHIDFLDKNKNIHFKIIDKNLIEETGGIVQGMSGSPIIQNEKFIGAINYVSKNDSQYGYAIFADKLF